MNQRKTRRDLSEVSVLGQLAALPVSKSFVGLQSLLVSRNLPGSSFDYVLGILSCLATSPLSVEASMCLSRRWI